MHKVDYSAWNKIQSERHNLDTTHVRPTFQLPHWFMNTVLVMALLSTAALIIKVLTYSPTERLTIEPVVVELEPLNINVDVNGESSKVSVERGGDMVRLNDEDINNGDGTVNADPDNPDAAPDNLEDDEKTTLTNDNRPRISCAKIQFPTVPKGTVCQAIRENGSITLRCNDQEIQGIPTLQCLFDRLPKDAFDVVG